MLVFAAGFDSVRYPFYVSNGNDRRRVGGIKSKGSTRSSASGKETPGVHGFSNGTNAKPADEPRKGRRGAVSKLL